MNLLACLFCIRYITQAFHFVRSLTNTAYKGLAQFQPSAIIYSYCLTGLSDKVASQVSNPGKGARYFLTMKAKPNTS